MSPERPRSLSDIRPPRSIDGVGLPKTPAIPQAEPVAQSEPPLQPVQKAPQPQLSAVPSVEVAPRQPQESTVRPKKPSPLRALLKFLSLLLLLVAVIAGGWWVYINFFS